LLAFGGWFAVLQSIDPYTLGIKGQALFYSFLCFFIWGLATLINYFLRLRRSDSPKTKIIVTSARQGFIAALGVIGLLIFRSMDVLNILSASVYIITLILVEFYFSNRKAIDV
jgi:ABC-type Fe3+-siderophore transport system permease subunit